MKNWIRKITRLSDQFLVIIYLIFIYCNLVMKKAINRFWDWMFHPAIRWYKPPADRAKTFMYRYPSPGSAVKVQPANDYRRPFADSEYNVRFRHPTRAQTNIQQSVYIADSQMLSTEQKLIKLGFLEYSDRQNQQAIAKAKEQYFVKFKVSADQKVYKNDFNLPQVDLKDRQSIQKYIEASFYQSAQSHYDNYANQRKKTIDEPVEYQIQSLDLYSDARFQQSRIETIYLAQQVMKKRYDDGKVVKRRGQAAFWKALDDSNDPQNITKVQRKVGDPKPLDFTLRQTETTYEKDANGNIVEAHPKQ